MQQSWDVTAQNERRSKYLSDIRNNGGGFWPSSHQRLHVSAFAGALIQFETCDNAFATASGFRFLVVAVWQKVSTYTDRKEPSDWIIYSGRYEIQLRLHPSSGAGAAVSSSRHKYKTTFLSPLFIQFNPSAGNTTGQKPGHRLHSSTGCTSTQVKHNLFQISKIQIRSCPSSQSQPVSLVFFATVYKNSISHEFMTHDTNKGIIITVPSLLA